MLPYGTSLINRFTRTTTTNWIARTDNSQAQVDGTQRTFPDALFLWARRPAAGHERPLEPRAPALGTRAAT